MRRAAAGATMGGERTVPPMDATGLLHGGADAPRDETLAARFRREAAAAGHGSAWRDYAAGRLGLRTDARLDRVLDEAAPRGPAEAAAVARRSGLDAEVFRLALGLLGPATADRGTALAADFAALLARVAGAEAALDRVGDWFDAHEDAFRRDEATTELCCAVQAALAVRWSRRRGHLTDAAARARLRTLAARLADASPSRGACAGVG
jgi:hypothetical protein